MGLRELEPDRAPAPMTIRCSGHSVRSKIVSLVRWGVACRPGIGGIAGEEPVAMTKRRALISIPSPTATVCAVLEAGGALDHPHAEPGEALPGIVGRDRRDDAADVVAHLGEVDRRALRHDAEGRGAARRLGARAAAISAFEGTQP